MLFNMLIFYIIIFSIVYNVSVNSVSTKNIKPKINKILQTSNACKIIKQRQQHHLNKYGKDSKVKLIIPESKNC